MSVKEIIICGLLAAFLLGGMAAHCAYVDSKIGQMGQA